MHIGRYYCDLCEDIGLLHIHVKSGSCDRMRCSQVASLQQDGHSAAAFASAVSENPTFANCAVQIVDRYRRFLVWISAAHISHFVVSSYLRPHRILPAGFWPLLQVISGWIVLCP